MDPLSIVSLTASVSSIVGIITKTVNALSTLQAKYRNADLSVFLLIGQLSTLKAALGQISEWMRIEGCTAQSEHLQLFKDLMEALNGCQTLISILDDRIDQLAHKEGSDSLDVKGKVLFLWEEQELNMYVTYLNNQVNALSLLLSAIHCRALSQERTLLQSLESRQVIQRLRDDTSSLLWLGCSESILSRKTVSTFDSKVFETVFDFDGEVFNSRVYQKALRSNMKQVLSHKASAHSTPGQLAPLIKNETSLLEGDETAAETETIVAKPVSKTPLIPTHPYQDTGPYTPGKVSLWSRLSEQIVSRKEPHLRTRNGTMDFAKGKSEQELAPRNGKTLTLGTLETGKSTPLKSLKLHMDNPYSLEERAWFKEIIFDNVVRGMRVALGAMKALDIPFHETLNEDHSQTIFLQRLPVEVEQLSMKVVNAIISLYMDFGVRETLRRAGKYQWVDGAEYYFRSIERLGSKTYIPTDQDILWSRVMTTKFSKTSSMERSNGYGVRGVRSERNKWKYVCDKVGTILFTINIASYDKPLFKDKSFKDKSVDDMSEALYLFKFVVNSPWFIDTQFALLFTKCDTLAAKLKASPMRKYFLDFDGGDDIEDAKAYITDRFVSLSLRDKKTIEVYYTSSIDDLRSSAKTTNGLFIKPETPLTSLSS